jgi:hypothetical protein
MVHFADEAPSRAPDPCDTKYCRNVEKDEFREFIIRNEDSMSSMEYHCTGFSVIQFTLENTDVLMAQAVYYEGMKDSIYQVRREGK